jgi:hypothetical protein
MRNVVLFLSLLAAALLALFVLLPLIGVILLLLMGLLVVGVGLFMAAPLLSRLPWFRDWIHVDYYGGRRIIGFGRRAYAPPHAPPSRPHTDDNVIDVEGRPLPEKD